ncbi:zonadhesin-like [Octopus sinensis]|uniref:Zonadhesin-like n=1 Tax=Octopus sinensis TaxID=2607531 RepID=A0A7E6EMD6_9MOLL|nr:zonadhesin-like [Octopus sinensis]
MFNVGTLKLLAIIAFPAIILPARGGATLKPCICKVSGDPHYRAFDGQMIHFMGTCKYTLATIKKGPNNTYFSVEVKNEHRGNNRISCTRLVDVKLTDFTIRLLPANKILINSEEKSLPVRNYKEFSATYSVGWITVTTEWGLKVMFDGRHRVTVTLPPIFADQLTGICGDCNGEKDDFRTKSGEDVSQKANKFSSIGASYQVEDDSDKPETKCKVNDVNSTCSKEQTKECDFMNDKIFEACIEKIGASRLEEYLESCRIDVCSYHMILRTTTLFSVKSLKVLLQNAKLWEFSLIGEKYHNAR